MLFGAEIDIMQIALLALFFAGGAAAADTNVMMNGDFSTASQLNGWGCAAISGTYQWSSEDAAGSGTSGSMQLTATAYYDYDLMQLVPGQAYCTSTCMPTSPSAAYAFGGQIRAVSANFSLSFACVAYTDSACAAAFPAALAAPMISPTTSWGSMPETSGTLPDDAHSVTCTATAYAPVETVSVLLDNIFFITTDVIFVSAFETP